MFMYFLYILKSDKTNRYYIGSTNNVNRRLEEHNSGHTKSLLYQRPLRMVFTKEYASMIEAKRVELKLKKYKNRNILEKIISEGDIKTGPVA